MAAMILVLAVGVLYGLVGMLLYIGNKLYHKIDEVLTHATAVLDYTEEHAKVNGSAEDRVIGAIASVGRGTIRAAEVAANAAQAAKDQVETATAKVIEKIEGGSTGDSGRLPTVRPEGLS